MANRGVDLYVGTRPPSAFKADLWRECGRRDDTALAQQSLKQLLSREVLKRDAGTCNKRFPCAFQDSTCEHDKRRCQCTCYKAMCRTFVMDFLSAVEEATSYPSCFGGSEE